MDRQQRQEEQRAKYAAMSRPRKIAMLVLTALGGGLACLLAGYLVGGEWRIALSLAVGLAMAATMAFQYRDAW